MLSLSWFELLLCAVLAIVVIGPKDLPKTARMLGSMLRTMRRVYNEARGGLATLEREIDLADSPVRAAAWQDFLPPEISDLRRSIEPHSDPEETARKYRTVKRAVAKAKADFAAHELEQRASAGGEA